MNQQFFHVSSFLGEYYHLIGVFLLGGFTSWNIRKRAKQNKHAKKILEKSVKSNSIEPNTLHPVFNPALCVGCGTCTRACPEGDILKLVHNRPVLVAPSHCVGHGECQKACPNGAISLVFGTKKRGMDIPCITTHYETNIPGLYIAGELGGMGLIRNAVKQGQLAAAHALSHLSEKPKTDVDLLVVGAGPAGLSAALTAIAAKKSYLCIEQNSFGGTVFNYPRQKIVMSHPAELPLVGTMKFPGNKISKSELLDFWNQVRQKTGLRVREGTRFETLENKNGIFKVKTSQGSITAKKIILAMGVRGTPRKLGLPNEDLPKVTYNLLDPEQYQNQHIAIVGGGNAAAEAAQNLAEPGYGNTVTLLVRGSGFDLCNEENQKKVRKLETDGSLEIRFETTVKEIQSKAIVLNKKDAEPLRISNDFLFVFAGAELPFKFLMSLGIRIEKKFGETISKAA